jgi:hypothetical protein
MSDQTPMHIAVEFEARTGQLESALAKATSSAQNLTVGLEKTSAETKRTVSSLGAVATQADGVSKGFSGVTSAAGSMDTGLGRLTENTGGLTRGLDGVKALTTPLTAGFAQLQTRIGALAGLAGGAATAALARLSAGVVEISAGVAGLTTAIGAALLTPLGLVCTAAAGLVVGLSTVAARMVGCGTDAQSLADQLEITVENAQRLTAATAAVGIKTETAAAAIRRLADTCADTSETGELARNAVAALGVSLTAATGTARSADHVFLDVGAALNEIPKGAARNAAAAEIFGDSWRDIAPLIDNATRAEQAYVNATPFTDEAIAQSTQLNDQVAELGRRFGTAADAVVTTVGSYLIPAFLALTDGIGALFDQIAAGWSAIEPIAARIYEGFFAVGELIKTIVDGVKTVCSSLDGLSGGFLGKAQGLATGAPGWAGKTAVMGARVAVGLPLESSPADPHPISNPASRRGASSVSPVQHGAQPPVAPPVGYPAADIEAQLHALRQLRSETDWALGHGGGKKEVVESYQFAQNRTALMADIAAQEQKLGAAKAAILEDEKRLNTARDRGEKISAKKAAEFAAQRAANEKTILEAEKALLALKKRRDALLDTAKIDLKRTLASAEPTRATTPQPNGGSAEHHTPRMVPPTPDSAVPGTPPIRSGWAIGGNSDPQLAKHVNGFYNISGINRRYLHPDEVMVTTISDFGKLYKKNTGEIAGKTDAEFSGDTPEEKRANRVQQIGFWNDKNDKVQHNVLTLLDQVAAGGEFSKEELANIKKMADSLDLSTVYLEAIAERARQEAKNPWWRQQSPSTLLAGATSVATAALAASEMGKMWRGYQRANQLDTALDRLIPKNSVMTSTIEQLESAVSGGVRTGFREVNASRPYDAYAPGGQMMGDVVVNVNSGAGGSTYNNYRLAGIVGASVLSAVATGAAGFAVAGPLGAVAGVAGAGALGSSLGGSS